MGMDVQTLLQLDDDLKDFVDGIFASLTRKGWQERCFCYLTGLMLDGQRKSVQPMAERLDEANEQSLQHFLANTPWDPVPVRRQLACRMQKVINPSAWVFDDTGFLKDGRMSPCVARQYTGSAGKVTNCQVATTLHLATDQASCPVNWRLFMPESWDPASDKASADAPRRRTAAGIPDDEHHRPKWQLALECVDEALKWGLPAPAVAVADSGYGDVAEFRHGLTSRNIPYAVQISPTLTVLPATATRTTPPYRGRGRHPKPHYEQSRQSVKDHIMALGAKMGRPDHLADRIQGTRRRAPADDQPVRILPRAAGRRRHPIDPQGPRIARMLADRRMASQSERTITLLAVHPTREHQEGPARASLQATLARRTRLPRAEDWPRP